MVGGRHRLDDADLVGAGVGQHDGELGLLGHGRSRATARRRARRGRHGDRSRLDAPLVLELLGQPGQIQHRHLGEKINNLFLRHIGHLDTPWRVLVLSRFSDPNRECFAQSLLSPAPESRPALFAAAFAQRSLARSQQKCEVLLSGRGQPEEVLRHGE